MSTPFQYFDLSFKRSRATAFTLIELLTVIAIIGVLAAILIPAIGRVRASANEASCASNLRQLSQALLLYTQENGGRLPNTNNPRWDVAALQMLGSGDGGMTYSQILQCPSDEVVRTTSEPAEVRSYSVNPVLMAFGGFQYADTSASNPPASNSGLLLNQITYPAKTVLLLERHEPLNAFNSPGWIASGSVFPAHSGAMNVAFCDGHVASVDASLSIEEFQAEYLRRQ